MTDIVIDMRRASEFKGDTYSSMEIWGLLGRGAAEIERLRADRYYSELTNKIEELEAENERLREEECQQQNRITGLMREIEWLRAGEKIWRDGANRDATEIERLQAGNKRLQDRLNDLDPVAYEEALEQARKR